MRKIAEDFRDLVLKVIPEKKAVIAANQAMLRDYKPDPNEATAMLPGDLMQYELFQFKQQMVQKVMDTNHFYVWMDVVEGAEDQSYVKKEAIFEYKGKGLLRFLTPEEKSRLDGMQAEIKALTKAMPPEYPYLMGLKEEEHPVNVKLNIRGNAHNLGAGGAAWIPGGSCEYRWRPAAVHRRQRPTAVGGCDREASAGGARDGESDLAASFRPRDREHSE